MSEPASTAAAELDLDDLPVGVSSWTIARRQFKKDRFAVAAAIFLGAIAAVAVPLNHLRPTAVLANTAMKSTPDTYSGVAVVRMATVDKDLSVLLPSRIPARIPRTRALGTIKAITHIIKMPVRPSLVPMIPETLSLKRVEYPQFP